MIYWQAVPPDDILLFVGHVISQRNLNTRSRATEQIPFAGLRACARELSACTEALVSTLREATTKFYNRPASQQRSRPCIDMYTSCCSGWSAMPPVVLEELGDPLGQKDGGRHGDVRGRCLKGRCEHPLSASRTGLLKATSDECNHLPDRTPENSRRAGGRKMKYTRKSNEILRIGEKKNEVK